MQEAWNVDRFSTAIRREGLHSDGEFGDPTTVTRARCFCGVSVWLLLTGFSLHS